MNGWKQYGIAATVRRAIEERWAERKVAARIVRRRARGDEPWTSAHHTGRLREQDRRNHRAVVEFAQAHPHIGRVLDGGQEWWFDWRDPEVLVHLVDALMQPAT